MPVNMTRRVFLQLSALASMQAALLLGTPRLSWAQDARTDALAYLPATEQIPRFKAGTLSPVDVLKAQIERIKRYNGPLNTGGRELREHMKFNGMVNAITYEHFDQAMKAAREAEKRYKSGTARALEGISVAIKDENDVKGWRTTMGSVVLQDAPVAQENATIIDMLLAEGALLHIQTTVPEFYLHTQTWSRLWGVTRNPWNLHYAVGGSSGGSGAALAAGFTTLATGSDMGGSIRIPASLCGLYGFKPPFGRVPTSEVSYETLGPLARTFADMVLMQNVITGPHPKVLSSLRPKLIYPYGYNSLEGVKIAVDYFDQWIDEGIDDNVRKSLNAAVEALRGQGAIVTEVKLGWKCSEIFPVFANGLLSTAIGDMLLQAGKYHNKLTTYGNRFVRVMGSKGPADMARADYLATVLHQRLQSEVFNSGCQALIMPTLASPYIPADNDPTSDVVKVNGRPVKGSQYALTYVWNLLSRYPVVDVPVGIADNNLPMGMQIVGNTFDDLAAFQVAYGYANAGVRLYNNDLWPDYRDKA